VISPLNGSATPAAPAGDRRAELRQAAQAFEAVFLRQMIGSMRQARLAEDPFTSQATEQFTEMSDAQLADSMSRQGSFGIAEMLLAQFDRSGGQNPATQNPARPAATPEPNDE